MEYPARSKSSGSGSILPFADTVPSPGAGGTVVVAGGGPAGMMAAIRSGELGSAVVLIEKNPVPGTKLLLTGQGRCNLTNRGDLDVFLDRYEDHGQFLRDAFKNFFNEDLIRFFEERGLKLHTEEQQRIFPDDNRAESVVGVLKRELERLGVKVMYDTAIKNIAIADNKAKGVVLGGGRIVPAERIILALGGASYPATGSTGDGFDIARKLGHSIVPLRPGLVPLETKETFPRRIAGLVLKAIRLSLTDGRSEVVSDIGDLLFTRYGVSGPLVLSLSGRAADWLGEGRDVVLKMDLFPEIPIAELEGMIAQRLSERARAQAKTVLSRLLPGRFAAVLLHIARIPAGMKAVQIGLAERRQIVDLLKDFRMGVTTTGSLDQAIVTRGGVSLREVDPRTMQSRLISGLYFAGEILDIAGDTGGFNLQAAFSTGYLAGESAALD